MSHVIKPDVTVIMSSIRNTVSYEANTVALLEGGHLLGMGRSKANCQKDQ